MANQLFEVYAEAPEANAERVCRICHRREGHSGDPFLEPCACRGPNRFAHKGCLERWLRDHDTDQCDVCHHRFVVLLRYAPLLDFFKDPDHRVDVLRMVVDAVSAAGDVLVLSFAWVYASGILSATGWILYLLVMSVLLFQTVFWTVVEVIRAMTCYEPLRRWRKRTASVKLLLEGRDEPVGGARFQNWRATNAEKKKLALVSPFTTPYAASPDGPLTGREARTEGAPDLSWGRASDASFPKGSNPAVRGSEDFRDTR